MEKRTRIVAIAGPSCSGKTAVAERLAAALSPRSSVVLALDAYYRDLSHLAPAERAAWNFDEPEALDWPLLVSHVQSLAGRSPVMAPVYDFTCHVRDGRSRLIAPADFIILEGLFALHAEAIRELCVLRAFIDLGDATCLARRLTRDTRERGRTEESVKQQYAGTVGPMAQRHVLPTRQYADIVLDGAGLIDASVDRLLQRLVAFDP